ncbi:MAG: hypothetical protein JRI80_00290 [Deltaproteobacteria bacterium]|nr:hypothetical protein [Deltaproteobacteria bacterium]
MSIQDVIGEHPGNQWPLRAYIPEDKMILDVPILDGIGPDGRETYIWDGNNKKWELMEGLTILRPTGVWGKKVCSKCYGKGKWQLVNQAGNNTNIVDCLICGGTGYVLAMIYPGDILRVRHNAIGSLAGVGTVKWLEGAWHFIFTNRHLDTLWRITQSSPTIILGSIFTITDADRPDGVSDEQWGRVMEQQRLTEGK